MNRLHRLVKCWKRPRPRNQRRSLPAVDKKLERKRVVVRHRVCVAYRIDVKTKKSRAVLLRAASGFRLPASFQITFITLLFLKKRFKFNEIYMYMCIYIYTYIYIYIYIYMYIYIYIYRNYSCVFLFDLYISIRRSVYLFLYNFIVL